MRLVAGRRWQVVSDRGASMNGLLEILMDMALGVGAFGLAVCTLGALFRCLPRFKQPARGSMAETEIILRGAAEQHRERGDS